MVEHIRLCDSSHSKQPDFDRFKGCIKQEKNVHSNQTGLKERQMISISHIYVHAHWCFAVIAVITVAHARARACTHTHTQIYLCTYMNVYKS